MVESYHLKTRTFSRKLYTGNISKKSVNQTLSLIATCLSLPAYNPPKEIGVPKKFDRLHGRISGRSGPALVLGHGFGCDQTAWTRLLPWFEDQFRVITFDFAGCGPDGEGTYDRRRHASLYGYADDLLEVLDELNIDHCAYIGHSVGSMIGAAAAVARPRAFSR